MRAVLRTGDPAVARASVEEFARDNPIEARSLRSRPITIEYADLLFAGSHSTFEAVGVVERSLTSVVDPAVWRGIQLGAAGVVLALGVYLLVRRLGGPTR